MITSIDDGLSVIDYVKALPYVDPNRLNLYGVSLGGNLVMNLVSRVPVAGAASCQAGFPVKGELLHAVAEIEEAEMAGTNYPAAGANQ